MTTNKKVDKPKITLKENSCAKCGGSIGKTKNGFHPTMRSYCDPLSPDGSIPVFPDERNLWRPCTEPLPIGSPVVGCPCCGHFFYINDGDIGLSFPRKCRNCKKKFVFADLGSIAFVCCYRNQNGSKEIQVTYDPEKYPNTGLGDQNHHIEEAKQLLNRWSMFIDLKEFRQTHIDVGDLLPKDFEHLGNNQLTETRPQFKRLLDYLAEAWEDGQTRMGGLYLTRMGSLYLTKDKQGVLEIRIPLRWSLTDEAFECLQDWIEDGNAEDHEKLDQDLKK